MPRNDAKRTNNNNNNNDNGSSNNNNTQRLPILGVKKITKRNNNNKKKSNRSRRKNNRNRNQIKNKNKNNTDIIIKQKLDNNNKEEQEDDQQQQQDLVAADKEQLTQQQQQHQQHELDIIGIYQRSNFLNGDPQKNWIDINLNINHINNCNSVDTTITCDVQNSGLKYPKTKVTSTDINAAATATETFVSKIINSNSIRLQKNQVTTTTTTTTRNTKGEYFNKKISSSYREEDNNNSNNKGSNIVTNTNNCNNNRKFLETVISSKTSSSSLLLSSTSSSVSTSSSSSSFSSSSHSPSPRLHCLSTLYPIVIESPSQQSPLTYLQNSHNTTATSSTTTTTTTKEEKHSTTTTITTDSLNVTCQKNSETETKIEKRNSITNLTATIAASEQLLEHKEKQQQQQQQQLENISNTKRNNNCRRRRRHFDSFPQHTPEVKARLATLRTRKNILVANNNNNNQQLQQQQQQEQQTKGHRELEQITLHRKKSKDDKQEQSYFEENFKDFEKNINNDNEKDILKDKEKRNDSFSCKRALPQQLFDVETLNRIETLSVNEVKKANNNKRKRNQTAVLLLGLNSNSNNSIKGSGRSKRITTVAAAAAAAAAAASATASTKQKILSDRNFSFSSEVNTKIPESRRNLSLNRDFLKPLPIAAANTNSKKRPRIMSVYERPYQTGAGDGRGGGSGAGGSVVGNGYMSTSRSSSSGGGGGIGSGSGGGALVMNDTNDPQDLVANQYYLSGSSGSGIAGNNTNSSALLGNGSAITHPPTTMGTLCNIGNTCYLNSVVYTLRFAPQFLHNLHHLLADLNALQQNIARARAKSSSLGRGISAVHMENARSWSSKDLASMEQYNNTASANVSGVSNNSGSNSSSQVTQKSSHQVLTEKLHDLYQSLYRNEMSESTEPHHADTLLHAIQDVSTIFEGNQQQDAHEFLMCVLNSIRETSQTLLKAIAECPDVILNGYIANPEDTERDLKHSQNSIMGLSSNTVSGLGSHTNMGSGGSSSGNMSVSSALSSFASNSKSSIFFSRKSKRKDETKNSKNTRLQSPLKDNQIPGGGGGGVTGSLTNQSSNSLFYLNANDLNISTSASSTSPPATGPGAIVGTAMTSGGGVTSPTNSSGGKGSSGGAEDIDNLALLLKDKQRLELKIRELGLDFFNEDFEGITVSTTKCLSCETVTEQKETMIDIAVPVPQSGYESNELTDRPSSFIQNSCITREYFRHENKYRCEQCCGYTEAIRSISYEVLPRLLIIQLSRFSGGMEKINSYIPTSFTLQCFCSKCCELSDANKLHIYKLYSVITHVGATMSVGHYIAYTCSLDWANEYINCPKEQRRRASQERAAAAAAAAAAVANAGSAAISGGLNGGIGTMPLSASTGNSQNSSSLGLGSAGGGGSSNSSNTSSSSFMKIMKFGRNKASSSGDMSKNVKHLNGLTSSSKAITNGIGKLTMNNSNSSPNSAVTSASVSGSQSSSSSTSPCQSINCCAMRLTAQQQLHYLHTSNPQLNAHFNDFPESETSSGYNSHHTNANYNNNVNQNPYTASSAVAAGYGSTGRGASAKASYASSSSSSASAHNHNGSEPIWYMCDDDKIKAMSQREFEELLSPARKITITPYLLFYARYNLQTTSTSTGGGTTSSSTPPKSASAVTMSSSSPGPASSSPQASWSNESLQSSGHSAHSGGGGMRM